MVSLPNRLETAKRGKITPFLPTQSQIRSSKKRSRSRRTFRVKLSPRIKKYKYPTEVRLRGRPLSFRHARHTARHLTVNETAINNKILRVAMEANAEALAKSLDSQSESLNSTSKYFSSKKLNGCRDESENAHNDDDEPDCEVGYYLTVTTGVGGEVPKSGRLNYAFNELLKDVRTIQLPPNWKIKIIVRKQQKISSIVFTNKENRERCIGFYRDKKHYELKIDNRPAVLLAAPFTIDSRTDLEILLDIVHSINSGSDMIYYL